MSQIKLKHSGGNSVIIAAPDSNPASDRTLKLPSDGDGTILTTNSSVGKILQVEQTVKTDTFSAQLTQGSLSGDAISLDFTATSSSNRLYITYDLVLGVESGNQRLGATLYVGGSVSSFIGDASSSSQRVSTNGSSYEEWQSQNLAGHALLSNPSTSSTTYSLRISHGNNSQKYVYMNRAANDDGNSYTMRPCSTLTIMEVAA